MWPYVLAWAIPTTMTFVRPERALTRPLANTLAWAIIAILTIYIGLRHQVGGDWRIYSQFFDATAERSFAEVLLGSRSPAYYLLNWLSARLGLGIYGANAMCALIFSIGLVAFCRVQPNPWLAATVASPVLLFIIALGYTRQSVAIGLFMLAAALISKDRQYLPIGLAFLGTLFHESAAVLLPIVAFAAVQDARVRKLLIAGAIAALAIIILTQIQRVIWLYIDDGAPVSRGALIRLGMTALAGALFVAYYGKMRFSPAENRLWLLSTIASFALTAAALFGIAPLLMDRLGFLFIPLQLAVLSRLPIVILPGLAAMIVAFYSLLALGVWLAFSQYTPWMAPYQNVLFSTTDNPAHQYSAVEWYALPEHERR